MPQNNVSDPITEQEKAFVHLVLSGTMTDRRAAKAVGFHPNSADHIKSSPRVRAYLLEPPAALQQPPVAHDAEQRRPNPSREQILNRLWEIASLTHEMTRNSISGQIKALSMIIAIEGIIPDRRAAAAQNKAGLPPVTAQICQAEWLSKQRGENVDPEPPSSQEEAVSEPESPASGATGAGPVSGPGPEPTPTKRPNLSIGPSFLQKHQKASNFSEFYKTEPPTTTAAHNVKSPWDGRPPFARRFSVQRQTTTHPALSLSKGTTQRGRQPNRSLISIPTLATFSPGVKGRTLFRTC